MKRTRLRIMTLGLLSALTLSVFAQGTERFVAQDGQTPDPAGEFTSWANAASNIQDAVDAAAIGDTVIIRAGHYFAPTNGIVHNDYGAITNVVFLNKPMTLRSESRNPSDVIIDGHGTNRAVAVNYNSHSTTPFVFEGLTITNSWNHGIRIGGLNARYWTNDVRNCVITDSASGSGIFNGSDYNYHVGLLVSDCIIRNHPNQGIYVRNTNQGNTEHPRTIITDSLIENNDDGALELLGGHTTLIRTKIRDHHNTSSVIGTGGGAYDFYNCLIYNNVTTALYILYKYNSNGYLEFHNTVMASNSLAGYAFRAQGPARIYNSIIRYNYNNGDVADIFHNSDDYFYHCNVTGTRQGHDNISSNPLFVDFEGGDFRLTRDSPCINTGTNLGWMAGATDLDGNSRIDRATGQVDIGAYEYPFAGTTILVR